MKKLFSVLAVLAVMGTANIFAMGIGAQAGYVAGNNGVGGALTFKLDKSPLIFAVDGAAGNSYFTAGVTADYWLANPKIESTWGYFYGIGAAAGVSFWDNGNGLAIDLAPRVVLGTNIFVLDRKLELYLQGAWQPTFGIAINGTYSDAGFQWCRFPINAGFRFWF